MAKACAPEVVKYEKRRMAKRQLAARGIHDDELVERQVTSTASAFAPHFSTIQGVSYLLL